MHNLDAYVQLTARYSWRGLTGRWIRPALTDKPRVHHFGPTTTALPTDDRK